jgi:lysophospholipase L1-like esterase
MRQRLLLLLVAISILCQMIIAVTNPLYSIYCGGNSFIDSTGKEWSSDVNHNNLGHITKYSPRPVKETNDRYLYLSERWCSDDCNSTPLNYEFEVTNGEYFVQLYFSEFNTMVNNGAFKVKVGGVETSVNVWKLVGEATAYSIPLDVTVTNGKIVVEFTAGNGRAKINAIEIYPKELATDLILCMGDSWSDYGYSPLSSVVRTENPKVRVAGYGVSGATAQDDAQNSQMYVNNLNTLTGKKLVWLSIGGNDIRELFTKHYSIEDGIPLIKKNIEIILNAMISADSSIQIVSFGYDFMNIPDYLLQLVGASVHDANEVIVAYNTMLETLSKSDEFKNNFKYTSILGTLQIAGDVPGAPNMDEPSPVEYMRDAIHPNDEGFELIMRKFYNSFLKFIL